MAKGKILYDKIKAKRVESDITQATISEVLGIPRPTYAAFELGKYELDEDKLKKLCEFLKLNIKDVYIEGFKNTIVTAVLNNKGGAGKTTLCNGLCYVLAEEGYKVLVIDSDSQMNLTHSLGILDRDTKCNFNSAMIEEKSLESFIKPTKFENLDIIVADYALSTIESKLPGKTYRETLFKRILRPIVDKGIYDYIIVDTSPSLGLLNFNIMLASNYCLVPCSIESFAVDGLEILTEFISECKNHNPELDILGIVKTKVDKREKDMLEKTEKVLRDYFEPYLFSSCIPTDVKIKKAQWENVPVNLLDKNGKSDRNYKDLGKEFVKKIKKA